MSIILVFFLVAIFIGIPVLVYDKTVEISSKYTLTRFLVAWPLRLSTSLLASGLLIVLSFLPITIVVAIVGAMLSTLLDFDNKYVEYMVYGVLILNATWIIRGVVLTTVKQFIDDISGKTERKS